MNLEPLERLTVDAKLRVILDNSYDLEQAWKIALDDETGDAAEYLVKLLRRRADLLADRITRRRNRVA
jgi:hypothetical protein